MKLVSIDGNVVERKSRKRPIVAALLRHRRTLQDISFIFSLHAEFEKNGRDCTDLDKRLNAALVAEKVARAVVFEFPVISIDDLTAKAEHIRELLLEGDEAFEKVELDMLLRSLIQTDQVAPEL